MVDRLLKVYPNDCGGEFFVLLSENSLDETARQDTLLSLQGLDSLAGVKEGKSPQCFRKQSWTNIDGTYYLDSDSGDGHDLSLAVASNGSKVCTAAINFVPTLVFQRIPTN